MGSGAALCAEAFCSNMLIMRFTYYFKDCLFVCLCVCVCVCARVHFERSRIRAPGLCVLRELLGVIVLEVLKTHTTHYIQRALS